MSLLSTKLTIKLSQADCTRIASYGEVITLVRSFATEGDYVVACAAFAPFGLCNTLTLNTQWAVYATQQQPVAGSVITLQTALVQPTPPGNTLIFTGSTFIPQGAAFAPDVFGLANNSPNLVQCGVAQAISINSATATTVPLVLATTPAKQTSYLQPLSEVKLFLASNVQTGLLLPAQVLQPIGSSSSNVEQKVPFTVGQYLAVDPSTNPTIYFDSPNNCFTLVPPQ